MKTLCTILGEKGGLGIQVMSILALEAGWVSHAIEVVHTESEMSIMLVCVLSFSWPRMRNS